MIAEGNVAARPTRKAVSGFALVVLVATGVVAACGGNRGNADGDASCGIGITFGEFPYTGVEVRDPASVALDAPLGEARVEACGDGGDDGSAEVRRVRGIRPSVAVGQSVPREILFVAEGRCASFVGWPAFLRCLREPLRFEGTTYTAIRLDPKMIDPVALGEPVGEGELQLPGEAPRPIRLAAIASVPPEYAVAPAGDARTVYVADGRCYEELPDRLLRCLRSRS